MGLDGAKSSLSSSLDTYYVDGIQSLALVVNDPSQQIV